MRANARGENHRGEKINETGRVSEHDGNGRCSVFLALYPRPVLAFVWYDIRQDTPRQRQWTIKGLTLCPSPDEHSCNSPVRRRSRQRGITSRGPRLSTTALPCVASSPLTRFVLSTICFPPTIG